MTSVGFEDSTRALTLPCLSYLLLFDNIASCLCGRQGHARGNISGAEHHIACHALTFRHLTIATQAALPKTVDLQQHQQQLELQDRAKQRSTATRLVGVPRVMASAYRRC